MLERVLAIILDEAIINRTFFWMGIAGPPVGALLGYVVGRIRGKVRGDLVDGTLCGLFGTLTLVMWHVYNAIVEALGLDTVKNLVVNLVLFLVLGIVLGLVLRVVRPKLKAEGPPGPGA
ncbi:MAG: hypothetical protein U0166_03855 [Acidobacteriota bacterium]